MNFGVSWSLKRIRPNARKSAEEAARRAGMPLEDWLNSVIFQQAAQMGVLANPQAQGKRGHQSTREFATAQQQHGKTSQRIEQLSDSGPVAYAPQLYRNASDQHVALTEQFQQSDGEGHKKYPPPGPSVAPLQAAHDRTPQQAPTAPTLELLMAKESGLEQQLERITDRIKTVRQSRGLEDTINALHGELTEIGQAINETMPHQAVERIKRQINDLSQSISEVRQNGVNIDALAGIERTLVEVCDAVHHHLISAENMAVFNDAIAMLAQKFDLIIGQYDPAKLQQLEYAITTLCDKFAYDASNETVMAAAMQGLTDKIASDVLNLLEDRIKALGHTLAEKVQFGNAALPQLDTLEQSLTDKIEQIQHTLGTNNVALRELEDRIVKLVNTLRDVVAHVASDDTVSALTTEVKGLADQIDRFATDGITNDVLDHLEGRTKALDNALAERAESKEEMRNGRPMQPVMEPRADMQPLDFTQTIGRGAVHLVPDVPPEPEFVRQPQPPARHQPEPPAQASLPSQTVPPPQPAFARQTVPDAAHPATLKRPLPTKQFPTNPDLPLNEAFEPESGPSQTGIDPCAQIAASKTALNGAHTGAAASGNMSDFIAAARRVAQAANQAEPFDNGAGLLRTGMMKRVKWPFIATTLIAIVVGSAQFVGNMDLGGDVSPAERTVR